MTAASAVKRTVDAVQDYPGSALERPGSILDDANLTSMYPNAESESDMMLAANNVSDIS